MIILYLSDMYCIPHKYFQILPLVDQFQPNYVIINGNLFTESLSQPCHENIEIKQIVDIIKEISKKTKVLLQFAGNDELNNCKILSNVIDSPQVINLTNNIYHDSGITFCGINFSYSKKFYPNKEWTCGDGMYKENGDDNIANRIKQVQKKLNIAKTIYVTYSPPIGVLLDRSPNPLICGSYDIRRLCEGELTDGKQPKIVLSAGFPDNFSYTGKYSCMLDQCICVQPSQPYNELYYCLIEIDLNLNITNMFHPKKYLELMA